MEKSEIPQNRKRRPLSKVAAVRYIAETSVVPRVVNKLEIKGFVEIEHLRNATAESVGSADLTGAELAGVRQIESELGMEFIGFRRLSKRGK